MSYSPRERRRLQRIRFTEPLSGISSHGKVSIVDLSVNGMRVEHPFPLGAGSTIRIDVEWNGNPVTLYGDVLRCRLQRGTFGGKITYASGVRFNGTADATEFSPREIMIQLVSRSLIDARRRAGSRSQSTGFQLM